MTDDCTIPFLLEDRDRLLDEIRQRDIKIAELERALALRDQLIAIEEGERYQDSRAGAGTSPQGPAHSDRGGREMTFKLFKVTLRGGINPGSTNYNASFVVAESPDAAYQAVRDFLDNNNLCHDYERELKSIELLAEDREYPACRTMLFLAEARP